MMLKTSDKQTNKEEREVRKNKTKQINECL